MKQAIVTAAALFAFAGTASAADMARPVYKAAPATVQATVYNWTGLYIGGYGGWARAKTTATDVADEDFGGSFGYRESGNLWGGTIGYNVQNGPWVLGAEFEIGKLSPSTFFLQNVDTGFQLDYGTYYVIAGRLGLAVDRALFYVKGGYASAKISNGAGEFDNPGWDVDEAAAGSKRRGGYAIGGGLEYGLAPNWSVKAEYLYLNFGTHDYASVADPDTIFGFKDTVQTVKLGVNYRFGDFGKAPVVAKY